MREEEAYDGLRRRLRESSVLASCAELLGWDARLDREIMDVIGCRSAYACSTHPTPVGRVHAYDLGRSEARAAAA